MTRNIFPVSNFGASIRGGGSGRVRGTRDSRAQVTFRNPCTDNNLRPSPGPATHGSLDGRDNRGRGTAGRKAARGVIPKKLATLATLATLPPPVRRHFAF